VPQFGLALVPDFEFTFEGQLMQQETGFDAIFYGLRAVGPDVIVSADQHQPAGIVVNAQSLLRVTTSTRTAPSLHFWLLLRAATRAI
jgi:hypothetical protein